MQVSNFNTFYNDEIIKNIDEGGTLKITKAFFENSSSPAKTAVSDIVGAVTHPIANIVGSSAFREMIIRFDVKSPANPMSFNRIYLTNTSDTILAIVDVAPLSDITEINDEFIVKIKDTAVIEAK